MTTLGKLLVQFVNDRLTALALTAWQFAMGSLIDADPDLNLGFELEFVHGRILIVWAAVSFSHYSSSLFSGPVRPFWHLLVLLVFGLC